MLILHRLRMVCTIQEDTYLTNERWSTDQAVQD